MVAIAKTLAMAIAPIPVVCHVLLLSGDMTLVSAVISGPFLIPMPNVVDGYIDLRDKISVTSWISVAILPLCIFLLISYAVLPVKWTHRHYLSICFTLGICCMEASWMLVCTGNFYG